MAATAGYSAEMVIAKESVAGTPLAISTGQREFFTDDPGINPVQTVIKKPAITHRHTVAHILADYHMEGSIPNMVTPEGALGVLLACGVGADTSALVSGSAYSHTYVPTDTLETFSTWFKRGNNQQVVVNHCVVTSLEFEQGVNDALRITAPFIGKTETINTDSIDTAIAYDTIDPFMYADLTVTGPTNAAQVNKCNILIKNNYDIADGMVVGSRLFNTMIPGKREVTGSFDIWFDNDGDYQSFWGSSAALTPDEDGDYSTIPLVFTWNNNSNFSTTYNHELVITIPEAVYESTKVEIGNRIKQTVDWSANYDSVDGYEVQIVLQNSHATDY